MYAENGVRRKITLKHQNWAEEACFLLSMVRGAILENGALGRAHNTSLVPTPREQLAIFRHFLWAARHSFPFGFKSEGQDKTIHTSKVKFCYVEPECHHLIEIDADASLIDLHIGYSRGCEFRQ